jgi:tRNA pseudouridine32 synthase/23S rRNA pseudouridine746 synthase
LKPVPPHTDSAGNAPLPARDGVSPSRVHLPKGPWPTVLDFLLERFPYLPAEVLRGRLERGEIVADDGSAPSCHTPYLPLQWLWYYRDVPNEVPVPFALPVLFQDAHLVAVDKPHFLASIPGGRYLRETALTRLRSSLDLPQLSPLHRLDRDTAGVLLFCVRPECRGGYQTLFQSRQVVKEYEAVAPVRTDLALPQVYRSRLQPREGRFTTEETAGAANSETSIQLLNVCASGQGHYRLVPSTGRKHQLRVHMSAMGIPICNDMFYPELLPFPEADDFSKPLQLLARTIEFIDPFSGVVRHFESRRRLALA